MPKATLIKDKKEPGTFRVESEPDTDGAVEVAIFLGPNALDRAIAFAGISGYYDAWGDPEGWSTPKPE